MAEAIAKAVQRKVMRTRNRFWRPEDFLGSPAVVAKALSRLAQAGQLRRVRRGLYWRGESTPFGMAPPPPARLADEIGGGAGVGPGEGSAAVALGLSTQVPRRETVAIPSRAPSPPDGVRIVSRAACTGRRDERLRPLEVALLEVLREGDRFVDVSSQEAIRRVKEAASDGVIRLDRVVRAADTEPARVRNGLRWLLDSLHMHEHADRVRPPRPHEPTRHAALAG